MNGPHEHAQGLVNKATNDLIAARATIATGQALDTVCFHAQQAVEKRLKGLLALQDVVYPIRHDLGELLRLAQRHLPDISLPEDRIILLAPYAVGLRYDDTVIVTSEEARSALEVAEQVVALALTRITPEKL